MVIVIKSTSIYLDHNPLFVCRIFFGTNYRFPDFFFLQANTHLQASVLENYNMVNFDNCTMFVFYYHHNILHTQADSYLLSVDISLVGVLVS